MQSLTCHALHSLRKDENMVIQTIRVKDFRNYEELTIEPSDGVNILYGQNGSGKTNLIEAVHYCALGKSHRTNQDREVVRREADAAACGVTLRKQFGKEEIAVKLTPQESKKKNIFIDRKKAQKISSLMGHLQCVIFSPEDLMIIKEGPGLRRRYTDMMVSQMNPVYFVELQKYQKALDQRNALLKESRKTGGQNEELFAVFEDQMAQSSEVIIPTRKEMIEKVQAIAAETYRLISGRDAESFQMRYQCCLKEPSEIRHQVAGLLEQGRGDDIFRGTTGFGLHREDIQMLLNGKEMKLFASQGQIRTASLSMKLAQIELFRNETGENPVLLLDDVMSELDMGRRSRLVDLISSVQTFITCTDESDIQLTERPRSYLVQLDDHNMANLSMTYQGITNQTEDDEQTAEPDFS